MKAKMILAAALVAAIALCTGCHKSDDPFRGDNRPGKTNGGGNNSGNGGNGNGNVTTGDPVAKLMSTWKISYIGREEFTEDNGFISDVERFSVSGPSSKFTVRFITVSEFLDYYKEGDIDSYLKDEQNLSGDVFDAPGDILFDRIRVGDWYAFVLGLDSSEKLTGEYCMLEFEIFEDSVAEDEYSAFLGTWMIGNEYVRYKIDLSKSELNYTYFVDGWETGGSISESDGMVMDQEWFETFYDRHNHKMYFVSQTIGTYDDENLGNVEEVFFGKIHYTGNMHEHADYIVDGYGIDLAEVTISEDGKTASVEPCTVTMTFDEGDSYTTSFYKMQYLCWSNDNESWYDYNANVPALPLTMTKVEETAPSSVRGIKRANDGALRRSGKAGVRVFVPRSERTVRAVKAGSRAL